jgi:hypothetical protein
LQAFAASRFHRNTNQPGVPQPVIDPTPIPNSTPPSNEIASNKIAQAQPPPITGGVPPTSKSVATAPAQNPVLGAVVARNWGWGAAVLLALFLGLGLLFASRSSRARPGNLRPLRQCLRKAMRRVRMN